MSLYYRKSNTEARDFSRVWFHRVEKMNSRIPKQGDVYVSRLSGANVVVLDYRYDEILGEHTIRFIGKGYISNIEENDFHDKFQFLGKNIDISELVDITKN